MIPPALPIASVSFLPVTSSEPRSTDQGADLRAQRQPLAPAGPAEPWKCPTCRSTRWWRHYPLEPWYCAACVPPVREPAHVERTGEVRP